MNETAAIMKETLLLKETSAIMWWAVNNKRSGVPWTHDIGGRWVVTNEAGLT